MANASRRIFEALEAIASEPDGVAVTDFARKLGVSKATASRLLASLVEAGFVTKADAQRHVLDLQLWIWGVQAAARVRRIAEIVRPAAIHAAAANDALIATTVLCGQQAVFLEVLIPSHGTTVVAHGHSIIPAYACAPGKAILAFAGPERQQKALPCTLQRFTDATLTSLPELQQEFALIRARGYALNRGEYYADTVGVAVPIFDGSGDVVAAVSSSGSTAQWSIDRLTALVPALTVIRDAASAAMGYSPTANRIG
jgi:DNA-binding IclR family transcriptional regulator